MSISRLLMVLNEFIYKLIYKWYKVKDWYEFDRNRLTKNYIHNKIKFKNSLEYNSKYLPESSREYFTYLKENINYINKLNELESLRFQKLYYEEHEIIVQFEFLLHFRINGIKKLEDYLSIYSIYNKHYHENLLYVRFVDSEVHKKYSPFGSNYPIHISNIRMVETESMRIIRLRSEVLDKILT